MEAGCERLQRNPQVTKLPRCRCNFAILKWGEMNGRKDEAVPAADGSWVLLPRRRNPPSRATPPCFYHCLSSSKFNQYFYTQPDSFPRDATEAKGGNTVYTIRAIKHGWNGCKLGQKKEKKKAPTPHTHHQLPKVGISYGSSLSLSVYIFLILFSTTAKYRRQQPRHYRPLVWSHVEALRLVQIYLDFCVEKA